MSTLIEMYLRHDIAGIEKEIEQAKCWKVCMTLEVFCGQRGLIELARTARSKKIQLYRPAA